MAQDGRVNIAGKIDDIFDGQEIARQIELGDEGKLALQGFRHRLRNARGVRVLGIAPLGPCPHLLHQIVLRAHTIGVNLARIFISELLQIKLTSIGHRARCRNRMRPFCKKALHCGRAFQMTLGIGVEDCASTRNRGLMADRGHDIVQRAALGAMVMHIIARQNGKAMRFGQSVKPSDAGDIIAAIKIACSNVFEAGQMLAKVGEQLFKRGFERVSLICAARNLHHIA